MSNVLRRAQIASLVLAACLSLSDFAPRAFAQAAVPGGVQQAPANSQQASQTATPVAKDDRPDQKGLAAKALDAAKSATQGARDIFSRVPCSSPKGVLDTAGNLPHVAKRLAAGEPLTIVAFGSSSTAGYGVSSPAFTYPNRLADQLRRKYPDNNITVINRGMGGQDTPEMMARLQSSVISANPDLVIWQLGTNTVVKGGDINATTALVEDGVSRMQALGADVVLIDPQYVPAVAEKKEGASRMVKIIADVAKLKRIVAFPRFEIMRQWHEDEKMPFDTFVIADGLHLNDWGYACFAQLLGDTIIKSVGDLKKGISAPQHVMSFRPM